MDSEEFVKKVIMKSGPNPSATDKVRLSNPPFPHLGQKNIPNTRLASFKPPRDLLLTGSTPGTALNLCGGNKSTKRTFAPNINAPRRKNNCFSEPSTNDSSSESNQKSKNKEKDKRVMTKKRNANVVQMKGVFSEGLAPNKVKAFHNAHSERAYMERQVMDKPKLNLNKKIIKSDEDSRLKSLMKDDFIDDPSVLPDISFIPTSLPIVYNVKKNEHAHDLEKTFETLQVKPEKITPVNINKCEMDKEKVESIFEGEKDPKLFLFEFPNLLPTKEEPSDKSRNPKGQQNETEKQTENSENLSSLGEGFLGYLRIHENGKAFLVRGRNLIPVCVARHGTRQELMSTHIDMETSKGEVINLGTIDASFTCSANFFEDIS